MEGSCYDVVDCRENAVVISVDINAELFLEVDWWDILRPSWFKSSMMITNYHVVEDNGRSDSCFPIRVALSDA